MGIQDLKDFDVFDPNTTHSTLTKIQNELARTLNRTADYFDKIGFKNDSFDRNTDSDGRFSRVKTDMRLKDPDRNIRVNILKMQDVLKEQNSTQSEISTNRNKFVKSILNADYESDFQMGSRFKKMTNEHYLNLMKILDRVKSDNPQFRTIFGSGNTFDAVVDTVIKTHDPRDLDDIDSIVAEIEKKLKEKQETTKQRISRRFKGIKNPIDFLKYEKR